MRAAQRILLQAGFLDCGVHLAPHGADLPLVGLSRLAPAGARTMLLLDFGHTAVKRAVAAYEADRFVRLHRLPTRPTSCESIHRPGLEPETIATFAERLLGMIDQSWREAERPLSPTIAVSLACYLRAGQPPPAEMGCYGRLQLLSENLQSYLADQLSRRLGRPIQLFLRHDGTAAALACDGNLETAVIMLGTAVGVGFPA